MRSAVWIRVLVLLGVLSTFGCESSNEDSAEHPDPGTSAVQPGYRASLYPTPWPADQANLNRSNSVVNAGLPVGVKPGEVAVESVEMPFPTFAYTREANEVFVLGGLPTSLEDIISEIDGEAPGENAFEPHLSRYNPETAEVVQLDLDRGTGTPYVGGALIHANGFVYVLSQAYLYKIDAETMDIVEGRQLADSPGRIYNGLATGRSGELITKYFSLFSPTPDSAFLLLDPDTLETRYALEAPGATPRLTVHEDESGREFLYHLNTETTFRFEITGGELVYDDSWVSRYDPYGTGAPNNEPTSPIIVGGRVHYCTNTMEQTSEDPMRIFWQEVEANYSETDSPLLGQPMLEGIDTPGWSFFSPAIDDLLGIIVGMDMGSRALVALRIRDDGSLQRLWQKNLAGGARPTIVGDRGYVYATDWVEGVDHLVLLDLETGTEILRVPTTATRPTVATIVVLGDEVYYGSGEPGRPTGLFHRFYVP
ncbi:MAG: hypothetical protein HKN93_08450 [Acidimicrobiia bacterium]|nr:hypothetical protein [Acidimicrobiia bacterium]